jgi:hypothetical protein
MSEQREPHHAHGEQTILVDYHQRAIRLSEERRAHILEHPEMNGQFDWIKETVATPDFIVATPVDPSVHVYHRFYPQTPVTRKYLLVAVKITTDDAFVLTAFFSSRSKKGVTVWQP